MRTYALDVKSASKAGVSDYISETGKYKGIFTRAEIVTSKQGTEGVEFSFQSAEGLRADYLQLWTYNRDGKELPSLKCLNAIMACLRQRELSPGTITVDGASKDGFPSMHGKPIGVLLQREEYIKQDGSVGYKFNLIAPFDVQTELTAGEILAKKTEPEQLGRMVAMLKDRPMQKPRGDSTQDQSRTLADMDDDSIPF